MGQFGSRSTKPRVIDDKDKAILELKVQRDKLRRYEKKLETVIEKEIFIAKQQIVLKNHAKARLAIIKKKYQQDLLLKTNQELLNIEKLTQTIEFSLIEKEVLSKLELGNEVLKLIHKELNIENIDLILSETKEGIEYQQEIDNLLSSGGQVHGLDHEEIMKELDNLILQEQEEKFPDVPENDIVQAAIVQEKLKQLDELEQGKETEIPNAAATANKVKSKKQGNKLGLDI